MRNKNTAFHIVYGVMLTIFSAIIIYLAVRFDNPSISDTEFSGETSFDSGWHTKDSDEEISIAKLNKLDGVTPYEAFSIFNTLPEKTDVNTSLFFRSKNIRFTVLIDGIPVYEPYIGESILYTKSPGTRWNCIDLPPEYGGSEIEIRAMTVYASARGGIDNIYIGSSGGMVLNIIKERLTAFITCVLILFVGVVLIIADIPVNIQSSKNHELLYLGLFSISVAVWCLSETNLIQLYFDDSRTMALLSCGSLMMISIPLVMYLDAAFGFKNKWIVPAVCIMSAAEFTVCWGLHLLGIADIHETLTLSHILLAVSAVLLVYTITRNIFFTVKNQTKNIYRILRGVGLSSIAFAAFIDIIRYYTAASSDSAMFVRIGLLIFIICYGSSSLENTINAVKLGIKTEFVSHLAYHDGLTGIGNRTAFEEHLVELEKIKDSIPAVGIIMFDVNDLKYVNDNLGHHYGDEMLIKSAEIIKNAFEDKGCECFRIGGDEYAVLLSGDNVEERYRSGIECFKDNVKQHNALPDKEFRISIAHGFGIYEKDCGLKKLMDVYQRADMKMYENKKEMKSNQIRPEEFYRDKLKEISKNKSETTANPR
ncbi:MAG: GGDEF domain-containing protein [Ruminococcus sp.]|nr:GGDEF domain-containing protein [Ruminococcus sp.]